VPQYFVMVGGAVGDAGASFGRVVAKIPARRVPEATERLIRLFADERTGGESAPAFFARLDTLRAKSVLADLEGLTEEDALPVDFVDLGEEEEFNPEVMEGECAQ
jgi:sulfite reductase (ferredoxin)